MSIHIPKWIDCNDQMCSIGGHNWSVPRLIEMSRELEVMEIPLRHLNVGDQYHEVSLRRMVMHINAINDADLDCPIILDEDGDLMDGRHRVMKAMLQGLETIKARRFDVNPAPCSDDN